MAKPDKIGLACMGKSRDRVKTIFPLRLAHKTQVVTMKGGDK